MDADAGIDSAHSAAAVDPDSDAISYFADFDINATVIELKVAADLVNYSQTINVYAVPQK